MSFHDLERWVLLNARVALNNPKLRLKDLMEWSTSENKVKRDLCEGEVMLHLPNPGVWIAVKKEHSKIT